MRLPPVRRLLFEHGHFALAYVVLAPLYLAPLVATPFLPAFDLPHHLAIVDALTKAGQPGSPYTHHVVGFELKPFVVHLVVMRALALVVSVGMAAKVLVGAVVLALPLATARLLKVSGRSTLPAILAFPLAYSMPLHYGLIAFVPAVPLLVWMLAEASNEEGWRTRPRQSALLLGALSLATFCTHLEAWGVGAMAAGAALVLSSAPWRARALGLASLAPSIVACIVYLARTTGDPHFGLRPSFPRAVFTARMQELAERGVLLDLWDRLRGVPVHLLRGFNDGSDVVAANVFFGLIAAGIVAGLANRGFKRPPRLRRPTPAAALVAVGLAAYFGLPHHAPPDAHSVYPRFASVLALLLLLTVPARLATWPDRVKHALAALLALMLSVHGVDLVRHYAAFGRELADFEHVLDASPPGLASGGLVFDAESTVMNVEGIFTGMPVYYVTERAAPGSSTWLYYCDVPQLPCHLRNPDGVPPLPHFSYPTQFDATRALEHLQLVFVRGGPPADQIFGSEMPRVHLLAESGRWRAFARR